MRELTLEQIKQTELAVLEQVAEVCEREGIRYFLDGGTLLGAVRHKGFIPWDDDIDICMPRPDYDRFIEYCKNNDTPFGLAAHQVDEKFSQLFAKAYAKNTLCVEDGANRSGAEYGVYVDIFPKDGLGDTAKQAAKTLHKTRFKRYLLTAANWESYVKSKTRNRYVEPIRFMFFVFSRMFKPLKLVKKIEKINAKRDFEKCAFVGAVCGCYGDREIMRHEIFDGATPVEFEGKTFNAPVGYDELLTNLYGDYMTPPPEDKRVTRHGMVAFARENE